MFSRLAHLVANWRFATLIIVLWVVAVGLSRAAPQPASSTQQQDFLPASDDSVVAAHIANDASKYPRTGQALLPMTVIFRDENGINADDAARARQVSDFLNDASQRPAAITGASSVFTSDSVQPGQPLPKDPRYLSSDGKTLTMTALFNLQSLGNGAESALQAPVNQVIDFTRQAANGSATLQVGFSGAAVQVVDFSNSFKNLNGRLTLFAVLLIIVLLLIVYRSVIMPFVPLICVGMAYLVSQGIFGAIARAAGLIVNQQSSSLSVVLILGAG
ncbi:MAG TPA: MMPL family transporter, partial [Dehalococcoidia bacterium]|nr:MMPL family transporter [Dehalococcoidia bacterium]